MPVATPENVTKILESRAPYPDDDDGTQEQTCKSLVEKLTEDEKEGAAQTSYAYSIAWQHTEPPSPECRLKMAMRFARRHLVAEKGDQELALAKMKSTLLWRKDNNINELRRCFDPPRDDDDKELMAKFRGYVEEENELQKSYISGFDRGNRAMCINYHRVAPTCVQPDHLLAKVWITERMIACTEFASLGAEETIVTVCDFAEYSRANSPDKKGAKVTINALQAHYPERLQNYCIVWCNGGKIGTMIIKVVWSVVQLVLDPDTKEKVMFLCDKNKRDEVMLSLVDIDQAMPFMITGGKQTVTVDMKTFLHKCPFTCSAAEKY